MNRLWQELFGRGLVKTSEDFGLVGDRPTHPELLDWLASEFMDRGWSWKQMVRAVVACVGGQRQDSRGRRQHGDARNTQSDAAAGHAALRSWLVPSKRLIEPAGRSGR